MGQFNRNYKTGLRQLHQKNFLAQLLSITVKLKLSPEIPKLTSPKKLQPKTSFLQTSPNKTPV
jgi:hypothetical protein